MLLTANDVDVAPTTTADISYRVARSREVREAAFRLVYTSYLRSGLGEMNRYAMRVTPYHLLPTTEVFVAVYQGEVIFTMSLVLDGKLGLPMESVYEDEVARLRARGLVLGEVSCLADRRSQLRGFFPVFLRTCRVMVQYGRRLGMHALLAAVHPRHARFYRRYMDFRVLGDEKAYPTVRNRPAVALWLDFARIDRERPESYDTFFGEQLPDELLQPQPMTAAELEHFRAMVDSRFHFTPLGDSDDADSNRAAETAFCVA